MIENPNLDAAALKAVQLTTGIVEAFGEYGGRDIRVRYRDEIERQIWQIDFILEFRKRCEADRVALEPPKKFVPAELVPVPEKKVFVPLLIQGGRK